MRVCPSQEQLAFFGLASEEEAREQISELEERLWSQRLSLLEESELLKRVARLNVQLAKLVQCRRAISEAEARSRQEGVRKRDGGEVDRKIAECEDLKQLAAERYAQIADVEHRDGLLEKLAAKQREMADLDGQFMQEQQRHRQRELERLRRREQPGAEGLPRGPGLREARGPRRREAAAERPREKEAGRRSGRSQSARQPAKRESRQLEEELRRQEAVAGAHFASATLLAQSLACRATKYK